VLFVRYRAWCSAGKQKLPGTEYIFGDSSQPGPIFGNQRLGVSSDWKSFGSSMVGRAVMSDTVRLVGYILERNRLQLGSAAHRPLLKVNVCVV
jgi:hypothetical protein